MDYSVAKLINGVGIVAGWLLLGIGVISFFVVAQSDVTTAVFSSGVLVASGLVLVAICQMANATIHTAEESKVPNELLKELIGGVQVAKKSEATDQGSRTIGSGVVDLEGPSAAVERKSITGKTYTPKSDTRVFLVKEYRGHSIERVEGTGIFLVGDREFEGHLAAVRFIDSL